MSSARDTNNVAGARPIPFTSFRELWQHRKFILINFVVVSLLAAAFSLLLPNYYRSSATILPSSAGGGEMVFGGSGMSNPLAALGFGSASDEINNYISILKSRRLRELIIQKFGLMATYNVKTMEDALKKFGTYMDIEVTEEAALVFGILDRDSLQAQAIAVGMLGELERTTIRFGTQTGERNRRFIKTRMEAVQTELAEAERAARDFTAKHGTFDLPVQLSAMVEQLVAMELALAGAEIEYNVALASLDAKHPNVKLLRHHRDEISSEINDFISGDSNDNLLPNIRELPDIVMEYARHKRDIEIFSALLEFLYPQYEQARLKEARDEPTLHVLDYPRVPQKKFKPHRALIVEASGLFALILSVTWVLIRSQWLAATSVRYQHSDS
ncbi:MAG: hypothetical protein IH971_01165 [Candidatus Marinimicrobia bacterium]|nr:hypothetical protein [Candidatus Neomarinimicrobiota bacterium]